MVLWPRVNVRQCLEGGVQVDQLNRPLLPNALKVVPRRVGRQNNGLLHLRSLRLHSTASPRLGLLYATVSQQAPVKCCVTAPYSLSPQPPPFCPPLCRSNRASIAYRRSAKIAATLRRLLLWRRCGVPTISSSRSAHNENPSKGCKKTGAGCDVQQSQWRSNAMVRRGKERSCSRAATSVEAGDTMIH